MKKINKPALLAWMLIAALALTGCAQTQEPIPGVTQAPAAAATETAAVPVATPEIVMDKVSADAVLATVNGVGVTRARADDIAGRLVSVYAAYGMDTTSAEALANLRRMGLSTAVQMEVMLQKGEEWGVSFLNDAEMAAVTEQAHSEWESVLSTYMTSAGLPADAADAEKAAARENAEALLASMGYTEQTLIDSAAESARLEKLQAEMVKDIEVSEEEISAAYSERVAADEAAYKNDIYQYELNTVYLGKTSCYVPAGYRGVTQILLEVDSDLLAAYQTVAAQLEEQVEAAVEGGEAAAPAVTEAQLEEARAAILAAVQPTVDEIRAELSAGKSFSELIDRYNTDPGMNDADRRRDGYSVHMDSVGFDPAFVKAAFSVSEIGQVSEPAVGVYGVYLVCYVRDVPEGPVPLAQVRSELTEQALAVKENEVFNNMVSAWLAEADVAYTEAGIRYLSEQE